MEAGFFEYTCTFWEEELHDFQTVHGVTYAKEWSEAMCNLEKYYDYIENIFLQGVEPSSVYEFEAGTVNFKIKVEEDEKGLV